MMKLSKLTWVIKENIKFEKNTTIMAKEEIVIIYFMEMKIMMKKLLNYLV
jgi:hypothetical protein